MVELLVVIVVIGILSAVTIIAFNGFQKRHMLPFYKVIFRIHQPNLNNPESPAHRIHIQPILQLPN
ncbi:hypothetical protein H7100_01015 [Candidatus Saccharibacteria bacterium]|nr:hypothetical protein [Candidatus Saccharibacteria bacterium]